MTIPCTLSHNGYSVKTNALADSGANGFVFIDTLCAIDIAKFLNLKAQRLPRAINVKGYNGKVGNAITHILRLHLTVDERRQYNIPLLILDLGSHNLILGRKWFAYLGVLIDAKRNSLQWPPNLGPSYSAVKEIFVPREALLPRRITAEYQADVDARDRAFDREDQRRAAESDAQTVSQSFLSPAQEAHDVPDFPAQGQEMTNSEANYDTSDSESSADEPLFDDSDGTDNTDNTDDTDLEACPATPSKPA